MSSRSETLAEWCCAQQALPERIAAQARRHLLDAVGAGVAGADHRLTRSLAGMLTDPGPAAVFGDGPPRGLRSAARINGVAVHALEIDDTEGCDHSAAVVLPAALAALDAVDEPVTGQDFLRAVVLGYETGRRVQTALGGYDAHNRAGWHSTATCGVFAATVAAATVLRLPAGQLASALGIASSAAAGTWAFAADGADTKRLHPGNAAASGLDAALLARAGIRGPAHVFDDVWGGLFRTYGSDAADPAALLAGLGEEWAFEHSAIKPYASCRSTHSAIEAVSGLLEQGIAPQQVHRIEVEGSELLGDMVFPHQVTQPDVARMSLPYSLALLLTGRPLLPESYDLVDDPELTAWMAKTRFLPRSATPEPLVRLVFADGTSVEVRAAQPRGSAANPLGDREVTAKFDRLTARHLHPARSAAIKEACAGMDSLATVTADVLLGLPGHSAPA